MVVECQIVARTLLGAPRGLSPARVAPGLSAGAAVLPVDDVSVVDREDSVGLAPWPAALVEQARAHDDLVTNHLEARWFNASAPAQQLFVLELENRTGLVRAASGRRVPSPQVAAGEPAPFEVRVQQRHERFGIASIEGCGCLAQASDQFGVHIRRVWHIANGRTGRRQRCAAGLAATDRLRRLTASSPVHALQCPGRPRNVLRGASPLFPPSPESESNEEGRAIAGPSLMTGHDSNLRPSGSEPERVVGEMPAKRRLLGGPVASCSVSSKVSATS